MKFLEAWDRTIDDWMMKGVKHRYQGTDPRTGLDCFRGLTLILYRLAGIELPDRVKPLQDELGTHDVKYEAIESYRDLFVRIKQQELRIGDLIMFLFDGVTHVAVVIGDGWAVHISAGSGVARERVAALCRLNGGAQTFMRYIGAGSDVFKADCGTVHA